MREVTVSPRAVEVVVFRDHATLDRENLLLSAGPLWMCGPFEWAPAAIEVDASTPATAFTSDARVFRLRDPIGFELLSGSLEVKENGRLR